MLAVRFLKKGKRKKNVKRKKSTHLNILKSDSQRGSHMWKQLLQSDCFYTMMLYLHPQRRPVSHPLFLESSFDVSLWLSTGDKSKWGNQLHTSHCVLTVTVFPCDFHGHIVPALYPEGMAASLSFLPWKPSPQWQAWGRRSQRCNPTFWQWPGLKYHSVRHREAAPSAP